MAIARTGSITQINATGQSGSQGITVPADATLMIVGSSGYHSTGNQFSNNPPTIASSSLTAGAIADTSTDYFQGVLFYYINPPTGSQTFAWNWGVTPTNSPLLVIAFYKGVNTADLIRDSYGAQSWYPFSTDTLTAQSGDLIIGWAEQYTDDEELSCDWTNATEVYDPSYYVAAEGSLAEKEATGNVQLTAEFSVGSDGGIMAIVLKPLSAVSIAPSNGAHSHLSSQPTFTIERNVTPSASAHSHTAAQPIFTVERDITPAVSAHSHVAEQAGVTSSVNISPAVSLHSHVSAQPTLTIERNINPAAISHSHVAAEPIFTVERDITPEAISHLHNAEQPVFTIERDISPSAAVHSHIAESPVCTLNAVISPSTCAHSHTSGQAGTSQTFGINPTVCQHGHVSGQPVFTFERGIEPADAAHLHIAESSNITEGYTISVGSSLHAHIGQSASVEIVPLAYEIDPSSCVHGHLAGSPTFTIQFAIAVNDSAHAHISATPTFSFERDIDPANSVHNHIAGNAQAQETTGIVNYFGFNLFDGDAIIFRGRQTG